MLQCYNDNQEACDAASGDIFSSIGVYLGLAILDQEALGCNNATNTSNGTSSNCPSVPEVYAVSPAIAMSMADISPKLHPEECSMPRVSHLQQCSLFMDSQLRAFDSYRNGLEACSLPGAWFLLRHRSLSVEVEGTNLEPGYNHTRLTKINVTFHAHSCNSVPRTYTADNIEPLVSEFIPPRSDDTTSPLQLTLGEDGSVVTLMATWLNTTIIIRQYAQFLSITLQVPGEISMESEGLCTGCPSDLYVNITAFNEKVPSLCPDDNTRAISNCFDHAGVANQNPLQNVFNNSYLEACVFSMFKIKTSEVLTMFNAIASDATLLMNVGKRPRPTPSTFTINPPNSRPTRPPRITEAATDDLTSTSGSSSSPQTQSFPVVTIIALSTILHSVFR